MLHIRERHAIAIENELSMGNVISEGSSGKAPDFIWLPSEPCPSDFASGYPNPSNLVTGIDSGIESDLIVPATAKKSRSSTGCFAL